MKQKQLAYVKLDEVRSLNDANYSAEVNYEWLKREGDLKNHGNSDQRCKKEHTLW